MGNRWPSSPTVPSASWTRWCNTRWSQMVSTLQRGHCPGGQAQIFHWQVEAFQKFNGKFSHQWKGQVLLGGKTVGLPAPDWWQAPVCSTSETTSTVSWQMCGTAGAGPLSSPAWSGRATSSTQSGAHNRGRSRSAHWAVSAQADRPGQRTTAGVRCLDEGAVGAEGQH